LNYKHNFIEINAIVKNKKTRKKVIPKIIEKLKLSFSNTQTFSNILFKNRKKVIPKIITKLKLSFPHILGDNQRHHLSTFPNVVNAQGVFSLLKKVWKNRKVSLRTKIRLLENTIWSSVKSETLNRLGCVRGACVAMLDSGSMVLQWFVSSSSSITLQ